MYAELSDFFYVWLKRSVGDLYPRLVRLRARGQGRRSGRQPRAVQERARRKSEELATRDYLMKMRRVFREMRRVVKPNGSMTVMFTHRETEMWNALGSPYWKRVGRLDRPGLYIQSRSIVCT